MKPLVFQTVSRSLLAIATGLLVLPQAGQAQGYTGHYPAGAEGLKAGSLPPPGIYLRDYNFFYSADHFKGGPPVFDITAYLNGVRPIWISDYKILGGNYGADVLVPFGWFNWKAGGPGAPSKSYFGVGDIHVEPITLSWHPGQFDLAVGYAFWAPNGDADPARPALISKGFWSHMITAGATWYPDQEKSWAISLLNRYEVHMEHKDVKITPGNTYTLEAGISKGVAKGIEVGVVGYLQQQVNNDTGPDVAKIGYNPSVHDRVVAFGPEVNLFCEKTKLFLSLRYLKEIAANDRPEGHKVTLTLTKIF
jgi:hypothetical protein